MIVHKSFRYRIYPTEEQKARLLEWEHALRFLWNLANEQRLMGLARPRRERRYPTAFDQINELTKLRSKLFWLDDVPRGVCEKNLIDLDQAWQRCFKKISGQPSWKRKNRDIVSLTETHPTRWRLDGEQLRFPKIGPIRCVVHRPLEGRPKTCTIKRDGDQWFASIMCEVDLPDPEPRTEPMVALDRGVVNIVADSNGIVVENPRHLERALVRLAHAQRVVARRRKGSKNSEKAKKRAMRIHRKVRRQREHLLHNISATYAKSHGTVVIEKLQPLNMVKASRGLARSINGSGWGLLKQQLSYKLAWSGGRLLEVPAAYSSQTCAECGHVDSKSRLSQAAFRCTGCGHEAHSDVNAARVLLQRFRAVEPTVTVCRGTAAGRPVKQKLRVVSRAARHQGLGSTA